MKHIYWDIDKIAMLTDELETSTHSHCMIQFFLCFDAELEIKVQGKRQFGSCMIVNKDVKHSFKTNGKKHLTIVFEPVSDVGTKLDEWLHGEAFLILDESSTSELRKSALPMCDTFDKGSYQTFVEKLYECCGMANEEKAFDDRILKLLEILEQCNCDEHEIEHYAKEMCLSTSRLSHLFREQAGISLKSFLTLHQLEKAFYELTDGKKITQAAMNAGFDSPSHFAATVKRMMGLSARSTIKDSQFLKVY